MPKSRRGSKVVKQKLERGQVGIAGEYAVMTELIINGFAAARTDGNSKDVDILCSHIETGRVANVQVKTLNPNTDYSRNGKTCLKFRIANRKSNDDMLEDKIKTIEQKLIHYVFCALKNPDIPGREKDRFFIATPEQVTAQIKERVKKKTSIIDFILYDKPEHTKLPKGSYGLIEDYEDNWESLGNYGLDSAKNEAKLSQMNERWPLSITKEENADYIDKIKLEYIKSAVVERSDLYYEHAASEWFMHLNLEVDGEPSSAFLWGKDTYKKIEDMILASGEFDCESEAPNQIGRYTYKRKKAKI